MCAHKWYKVTCLLANMETQRNRCWLFTLNNYTQDDLSHLFEEITTVGGLSVTRQAKVMDDTGKKVEKANNVSYIVVGMEVGDSGTPHLQGYVEFKNARRLAGVRKVISMRAAFFVRGGTPKQASDYCKKGEQSHKEWEESRENGPNFGLNANFREYGTRIEGAPGKRTDLIAVRDEITAGKPVSELAFENPMLYHQYGRTLNYLEDLTLRNSVRDPSGCTGIWYFGPTNVGKSHLAMANFDPKIMYKFEDDKGWWDGYNGQKTVILNEFRGEIPYKRLLELCDKWNATVSRRNRPPMPFLATHMIVTSSMPPEDIYWRTDEKESIDQLLRRFTVVELKPSMNMQPNDAGGMDLVMSVEHIIYPPKQQSMIRNPVITTSYSTHDERLARRDAANVNAASQLSLTDQLKSGTSVRRNY